MLFIKRKNILIVGKERVQSEGVIIALLKGLEIAGRLRVRVHALEVVLIKANKLALLAAAC